MHPGPVSPEAQSVPYRLCRAPACSPIPTSDLRALRLPIQRRAMRLHTTVPAWRDPGKPGPLRLSFHDAQRPAIPPEPAASPPLPREPTTSAELSIDAASQCSVSDHRSEEHTSELQSHSFISYAVFCLKK